MAQLTNVASRTSPATTCATTDESTCSPALVDGPTPSNSPDGPQLDLFGRVAAPVSRSVRRASAKAKPTSGTCGRTSFGSSASAALQLCLANRLLQTTDTDGWPEYVMTWRRRAMPSGVPICRLAASGRRTSGNGCSGWPTPMVRDWKSGAVSEETLNRNARPLNEQAVNLAGWATPQQRDGKGQFKNHTKQGSDLSNQVLGATANGCPVPTAKCGVLNPFFSGYLMGYPVSWGIAGIVSYFGLKKR